MEIYIVRHGETFFNADKRLQGRTDIELNEYGRQLASETGITLEDTEIDLIYSSPLIRAYETASLIRGHRNIPIIRDERLLELSFGDYEGESFPEHLNNPNDPFRYFFKQPDLYKAPRNGESLEHLIDRATDFMKNVIEPLENTTDTKRIMIVAHGALNKGIMCYIKNHGTSEFWSGGLQKNCNVIICSLNKGKYNVIDETKLFYNTNE